MIQRKVDKYGRLILFFILFFSSLIISAILNIYEFPFDAGYYWTIGDGIFSDGGFHITAFPETFRGYFYPMVISFMKLIFPGMWGWRVLAAFLISLLFSFLLPGIFNKKVFECSLREGIGILLGYTVFMLMWGNFVQYPLSDIPATFMLCLFAFIIKKIEEQDKLINAYILAFLAGLTAYAAYNTRVVSMYAIIALVFVYIIRGRKSIKKMIPSLICMLMGIIILAIPQSVINKQYIDSFVPRVVTECYYNYNSDIQSGQLYAGIYYDRFEGYVGDYNLYPNPGVNYYNNTGLELIKREGFTETSFSVKQIIKLFIKYPVDMITIYVRHVVSLMTLSNNKAYLYNIYYNKLLYIILSIFIWIIAGTGLSCTGFKNDKEKISVAVSASCVCIPCFLQLFGAPEIRFFFAVYIIGYYYVFGHIDYKNIRLQLSGRWLGYIICVVAVFLLWLTLFSDILIHNEYVRFLVNDAPYYKQIIGR